MATKPSTGKTPSGSNRPKGGKKQGSTKGTIKVTLLSKIEELVRTSELDMMLQRRNLGLEPKGDMKDFIRQLIRNLKKRKSN